MGKPASRKHMIRTAQDQATGNQTRGLTLGKFAPLHKGHQFLIETALAEVDHLTVIIYNEPSVTDIPLSVRASWIRQLYPAVRVIEAWDGPTETGDTPEIRAKHEDYILRVLGIGGITHFYSSEFYGQHMSKALGAQDRRVDPARAVVPISGRQIRQDPFAQRQYLHPSVLRSHLVSVAFLGAPCSGKTTIASALAQRHHTAWMPEYGREYWERYQNARRLTPRQLLYIAQEHLRREDELLAQANGTLFCDTNAITTYTFAQDYHGSALPRLAQLAQSAQTRYDLTFLCEVDIPYDDTWDRSGDVNRQNFQQRIVADLLERRQPFIRLRGNLEERMAKVDRALSLYRKYQPQQQFWKLMED